VAAPIRALRDVVTQLRTAPEMWARVDDRTRAMALIGLSYDRRDTDLALCRSLLAQEVAAAERSDADELPLACFLVARARDPDDVWLMTRAKLANYDTFCGLDREYLFAAGVARTVEHVRASPRPERQRVLDELLREDGTPLFDEAELVEWWTRIEAYFPEQPEVEPLVVAEYALRFGTKAEALWWLEAWALTGEVHDHPRARDVARELAGDPELARRVSELRL
jgi:hypothetical protein